MHEFKNLIAGLSDPKVNAAQIFYKFAERIRSLYGTCGVAVISTTNLKRNECQITVNIDQHGNIVFDHDSFYEAAQEVPVHEDCQLDELLSAEEPQILHNNDPRVVKLFGEIFTAYIDIITLPILLQGKVEKWMLLLFTEATTLTTVDIERIWLISTLATNYSFSLENTRKLKQANQWIENELCAIARIQKLLLPQDITNTPGLRVAAQLKPFAQVGGDYYDITPLTPMFEDNLADQEANVWGFMIADASGHGSAAAVEIAMFDAILRTYPPNIEAGPAGVFNYVNRYLFTRTGRGSFISAFISAYIPDQRQLIYSNAGHPPPILKPSNATISDGTPELIRLDESMSIPLGISTDAQWQNAGVEMNAGDILVLYTDGVTEARSVTGEMFGQQRLEDIVTQSESHPDTILQNIEDALAKHQGNSVQNDDQTLLVIQPLA